jgi:UDP-glucose:(heptosyl)LPS alpha-1,3-glucosyltransferase
LIRGLLHKGVDVTLLTLPGQRWPLVDKNLKVIPVGIGYGNRLLQAWSFNRGVNEYLRSCGQTTILSLDKVTTFTHLHAGGGTHKTFLKLRRRYSGPIVDFFRRTSPFHRYLLHVEKKGFESPKLVKVRCNSEMVREDVQQEYGVPSEKLVVIHSGIRWKAMQEAFDGRQRIAAVLRQKHGIDPAWRSLLFLGSGFDRKGLDIAIQGLSVMPSAYHLIVVGKGATGTYARLAARLGVGDRVHFIGPQPDGWQYAALCKAMVLPSQYDPFGGAAAEGHAMGIPVLVSDKTGYADRVVHGLNGVIIPTPMKQPQIEAAFADLHKLIESPTWSPEMLREHAHQVDDDVILERLLREFIC